jgi:hypothetical protein
MWILIPNIIIVIVQLFYYALLNGYHTTYMTNDVYQDLLTLYYRHTLYSFIPLIIYWICGSISV